MDRDKIVRLSQVILQIFRLSLQQGSSSRISLIGGLRGTKGLTREEVEELEEKIFSGILNVGTEWFAENFPTLSLVEKCSCGEDGCPGWRMRKPEKSERKKVEAR